MWLGVQATIKCRACGDASAANAAVPALPCLACGAALALADELWPNALRDGWEAAASVGANATTRQELEAGAGKLTLALSITEARCPHCEARWDQPSTACPQCRRAVSVRSLAGYTLVAEDPGLLGAAVPQTIACAGCGAALVASGASRTVGCAHCNQDNVIPDPVWRRIHAPRSVARWYVYREGTLPASRVKVELHGGLAADETRLYLGGKLDDNVVFALIALDRRTGAVVWSIDLESHGLQMVKLAVRGNELYAVGHPTGGVQVFEAATGRALRRFDAPMMAQVAPDPDGTVLVVAPTHPLRRLGPSGESVPVWPTAGFFKGLFGGGGPSSLSGEVAMGHDGDLRVATEGRVERRERSGKLRWSAKVPGVTNTGTAPFAAADGTTWVVFRTGGGSMTVEQMMKAQEALMAGTANQSVLVRIAADGSDVRVVRESGMEEFSDLAVTPDGEVWVAAGGTMFHLDPQGQLLEQRRMRLYDRSASE